MSVYVDEVKEYPTSMIRDSHTRRNGRKWSHMTADTLDELHIFAAKVGLKREWFQNHPRMPHYDLTPPKRAKAVELGAIPVSTKEMINRMRGV